MKNWIGRMKLKLAFRWIKGSGFSVVRMVERAGSVYLVDNNGTFHKIGRGK